MDIKDKNVLNGILPWIPYLIPPNVPISTEKRTIIVFHATERRKIISSFFAYTAILVRKRQETAGIEQE